MGGLGDYRRMFSCSRVYVTRESEEERWFLENGGRLLEELIKSCGRKYNPIRIFSKTELRRATNNYDRDRIFHMDGFYNLYKGRYEDRSICVKKSIRNDIDDVEACINEVVIASQMNHKNFLKLLGCCLETQVPESVYEFAENGNLSNHMNDPENSTTLSCEMKLRIATEIADAVSYLHNALSRPIIHRDIKPQNIFLDEQYCAKLFDFSLSVSIPLGETYVETELRGSTRFIASEIMCSGRVTEKSDVYNFGIVLLEILTGKRLYQVLVEADQSESDSTSSNRSFSVGEEKKRSIHYATEMIVEQYLKANMSKEGNTEQQMACAELVMRCIKEENLGDQPTMKSVAQELRRIRRLEPISSCFETLTQANGLPLIDGIEVLGTTE